MLKRLMLVGESQGQDGTFSGRGRLWARREEEQARLEREAKWLEKITGSNLARRGDFPLL